MYIHIETRAEQPYLGGKGFGAYPPIIFGNYILKIF